MSDIFWKLRPTAFRLDFSKVYFPNCTWLTHLLSFASLFPFSDFTCCTVSQKLSKYHFPKTFKSTFLVCSSWFCVDHRYIWIGWINWPCMSIWILERATSFNVVWQKISKWPGFNYSPCSLCLESHLDCTVEINYMLWRVPQLQSIVNSLRVRLEWLDNSPFIGEW